jgi:hypothetical protein
MPFIVLSSQITYNELYPFHKCINSNGSRRPYLLDSPDLTGSTQTAAGFGGILAACNAKVPIGRAAAFRAGMPARIPFRAGAGVMENPGTISEV